MLNLQAGLTMEDVRSHLLYLPCIWQYTEADRILTCSTWASIRMLARCIFSSISQLTDSQRRSQLLHLPEGQQFCCGRARREWIWSP